jgi:ABC-2 type transport system ATP-binding protein
MTAMLEASSLSKRYEPPPGWLRPFIKTAARQPVDALRDVSLHANRGEVVGLVGPNGAGKTTLIKIISTLLQPTEGRAAVDGFDVMRQSGQVRHRLGLVLEGDQGLYGRLTGRQNLEFYGRLAGMQRDDAGQRAEHLLTMVDLAGRDKLVFGYSAGMKARLSICRALMADPPLVVLDEPTRSLDPVASRSATRLFRGLADEGRAVLLSNHRLDEVVAICDRIVAIVHGRVCFTGTVDQLAPTPAEAATSLSELLEREATA